MKRFYAVWNRNYKACLVVADDPGEVVNICVGSKHIRKPHMYRKFEDQSDQRTEDGVPGADSLRMLLIGNQSGCVTQADDGTWAFP